jgi:hypothetical protein
MIDCIEFNVAKAVDYVKGAADDVHIADDDRKKALHVRNLFYLKKMKTLVFLFRKKSVFLFF